MTTPPTPPRRAKLVLLVLAIAVVGLGVWAWEPVWWWVTTGTVPVDRIRRSFSLRHPLRGYDRVKRWDPGVLHGRQVVWYAQTGMMAWEGHAIEGSLIRETLYLRNGKVMALSLIHI